MAKQQTRALTMNKRTIGAIDYLKISPPILQLSWANEKGAFIKYTDGVETFYDAENNTTTHTDRYGVATRTAGRIGI